MTNDERSPKSEFWVSALGFLSDFVIRTSDLISFQPFSQSAQSVVRARDDLDADDRADLCGGGRSGIGPGFEGGDVAPEKHGDVTAADFFPAGDGDIRRLEGGVGGFNGGAATFAFDHSNCLLCHKFIDG